MDEWETHLPYVGQLNYDDDDNDDGEFDTDDEEEADEEDYTIIDETVEEYKDFLQAHPNEKGAIIDGLKQSFRKKHPTANDLMSVEAEILDSPLSTNAKQIVQRALCAYGALINKAAANVDQIIEGTLNPSQPQQQHEFENVSEADDGDRLEYHQTEVILEYENHPDPLQSAASAMETDSDPNAASRYGPGYIIFKKTCTNPQPQATQTLEKQLDNVNQFTAKQKQTNPTTRQIERPWFNRNGTIKESLYQSILTLPEDSASIPETDQSEQAIAMNTLLKQLQLKANSAWVIAAHRRYTSLSRRAAKQKKWLSIEDDVMTAINHLYLAAENQLSIVYVPSTPPHWVHEQSAAQIAADNQVKKLERDLLWARLEPLKGFYYTLYKQLVVKYTLRMSENISDNVYNHLIEIIKKDGNDHEFAHELAFMTAERMHVFRTTQWKGRVDAKYSCERFCTDIDDMASNDAFIAFKEEKWLLYQQRMRHIEAYYSEEIRKTKAGEDSLSNTQAQSSSSFNCHPSTSSG